MYLSLDISVQYHWWLINAIAELNDAVERLSFAFEKNDKIIDRINYAIDGHNSKLDRQNTIKRFKRYLDIFLK